MKILPRALASCIRQESGYYPIVTILGPRQSGKTTLARDLFPDKPYFSLEDPDVRQTIANDPRRFLQSLDGGAIIDEVQQLPELSSYLQTHVDLDDRTGQFILTGSHQLLLHQTVSQSLAGRTAMLKLMPLSVDELDPLGRFTLDEYLYQGMYPRIYRKAIHPTSFYRDYVANYLERDVRQLVHVKDLRAFQQFLSLCASRTGQLFNGSAISQELGVSHTTVKHWLSVLLASHVVVMLSPYYENFGKRTVKTPKLYFVDVGLASFLLGLQSVEQVSRDPLRGSLVENFVVLEMMKQQWNQGMRPTLYFHRGHNQREVDVIVKQGHQLIPVEIKSSCTFHPRFVSGLDYFQSLVPDRVPSSYLVYAGDRAFEIHGHHVLPFGQLPRIFSSKEQC